MRKRWKRAVSFLVSASMVVCMTPTAAFAKTTEESAGDDTSVALMVPDEASTADTDEVANVASTESTEPASTAAAEEMDEAATEAATEETSKAETDGKDEAAAETATEAVTEAEEPASTDDASKAEADDASKAEADDASKAKTDDAAAADDTAKTDDAAKSDGKNATDGKDDAATEPATDATTEPAKDASSKKKKPEPANLGAPSYAITPMTLDTPLDLTLEEDEMWVGSFTAPSDGSYVFYQSTNYDVDLTLYSDAKLTDELGNSGTYYVDQLAKGQTVYMALRALYKVEFETCVYSRGSSYVDMQQFKSVYVYTGEPVKLETTVIDSFGEMTEGLDFEFLFYDDNQDPISGPPTEAGNYYVRARALSYGEDSEQTGLYWFSIVDKNNLSAGSFTLEQRWYDITSGPVEVKGVVHDSQGNVLTQGVDYVILFNENDDEDAPPPTEPGEYCIYAKGIGETYFGTIYANDNIYICDPYDIGDGNWFRYDWEGSYGFPYQEEAVTLPELSIYHWDETTEQNVYLEADTDFKFSHYEDKNKNVLSGVPTDVGLYYAVYEGCGEYTGEYRWQFRITGDEFDLSYATVELGETYYDYNGEPIDLSVSSVEHVNGFWLWEDHYELVCYDEDGNELSEPPSEPGTYQVAARAAEGSDYKGETPKVTFYIRGENDLGYCDFDCYWDSTYNYTGEPIHSIDIRYVYNPNGDDLTEGVDYVFDHFEDNQGNDLGDSVTEVGSYNAVIRGEGSYTGTKKLRFSIVDPYDLSRAWLNIYNAALIDGTATPEYKVYDSTDTELEPGTDYVLVYVDEYDRKVTSLTEPGTYYAYAKPGSNGKYNGKTGKQGFTVYALNDISAGDWYGYFTPNSLELSDIKAGKYPVPTICRATYDDEGEVVDRLELVEGEDYILDHIEDENGEQQYGTTFPTDTGYYVAYYKAQGDYTGTRGIAFTIYDTYDLAAYVDHEWYWSASFENSNIPVGTTKLPALTICHWHDDEPQITLTEGTDYELDHIEDSYGDPPRSYGKTIPQEPGDYYAVYKGKSPYYGERSFRFTVYELNDLSAEGAGWVGRFSDGNVASGATTLPTPEVYRMDENGQKITLKEGTDFVLDYMTEDYWDENLTTYDVPDDPGDYYAVYRGTGNYKGRIRISFHVYDTHDLGCYTYDSQNDNRVYYWNTRYASDNVANKGDEKLPAPLVYHVDENGVKTTLTEGTDFELDFVISEEDYEEFGLDAPDKIHGVPDKPGFYYAFYKGCGAYYGRIRENFYLNDPYDIGGDQYSEVGWHAEFASRNRIEAGVTTLPAVRIFSIDEDGAAVEFLKEGTDFELARIETSNGTVCESFPKTSGEYYAVFSGKGSYHGERKLYFTVYEPNDIGNGNWYGSYASGEVFLSDGKTIDRPTLIVRSSDRQRFLTEDKDFEFTHYLKYDENDGYIECDSAEKGGNFYAVYSGKGDYSGELRMEVTVVNTRSLSYGDLELAKDTFEPTGKPVVLTAQVKDYYGKILEPSKDFEWRYEDRKGNVLSGPPTEQGDYYLYAEAKEGGSYEGKTDKLNFRIGSGDGTAATRVTMKPGTEYSVKLEKREFWIGEFTAPETGLYYFGSEGMLDTYGELYSDEALTKCIAQNDDAGKRLNFRIAVNLMANQKVYLRARLLGYEAGSFTVKGGQPDRKDLSLATFTINDYGWKNVGNLLFPGIVVEDVDGTALTEGKDYDFQYYDSYGEVKLDSVTEPGTYKVVAVGKNGYKNETDQARITVKAANDLSAGQISMGHDQGFELGQAVEDYISVTDGSGKELTKGVDYELVFYAYASYTGTKSRISAAPTEVGDYCVVAKAIGGTYTGKTKSYDFWIYNPKDITRYTGDLQGYSYIEEYQNQVGVPVYTYEGQAVKPELPVYDQDGNALDPQYYTVTYANNDGPTTDGVYASATVTGVAPYTGTVTRYFKIVDKIDLATLYGYGEIVFTGKKSNFFVSTEYALTTFDYSIWEDDLQVSFNYERGDDVLQLENGVDFNVTFIDEAGNESPKVPTAAGAYQVVLEAVDGGKYKGSLKTRIALQDERKPSIDISKAKVTLGGTSYTYSGKAMNPGVKSVVVEDQTLVEGTDYTVTVPTGRTDAGTYTYTITGKGSYSGKVTASFKINQAASKISLKAQAKTYNGKAQKYTGKVTKSGSTGKVTYTYYTDAKGTKKVSAAKVKTARTYYVRATLKADKNHKAATSNLVKFTIKKAANTLTLKVTKKKAFKAANLKKKKAVVKLITVKKKSGAVTYKLKSVKKKTCKKYFAVNAKSGKITVKKGLKKGTYTLTVAVTSKGDTNHNKKTQNVTIKIVVK